jgi:hypothetical protein
LDKLLEQVDAILDPTLEVQTKKGETTKISFPNSSSLVAKPFSSYNHPPQESFVQHFPTAHIDDLKERVNQLMATRHAHTQPSHTHAPHQLCSHYYHFSHQTDDCPFINYYVIKANKSTHEHAQTTTILVSEEKAVNMVEEKEEQIEPPPTTNLSNDKEVSTEAHSFITILLKTQHEPQVSPFQRLEEPSYVEICYTNLLHSQTHESCTI